MQSGIKWTYPPDKALKDLAVKQGIDVHAAVLKLANQYVPAIDVTLNNLVPWHNGEPDAPTPDEPVDLFSWVEDEPGKQVVIYMSHFAMVDPEPTLDDELAFVPVAIDIFGPQIMADIAAMLRK